MLDIQAEADQVAREAKHKVFCEFCAEERYDQCHLCSVPLCTSHIVIVTARSGIKFRCEVCQNILDGKIKG